MENRNGLCVGILVTDSTQAEHRAAHSMLPRARRRRIHPKTLAADKGYHVKEFVAHLREHQIRQHIARINERKSPGLDVPIRHIGLLCNVIRDVRRRHRFTFHGWVVLAEHMHCVLELPSSNTDFATR